MKKMLPAFALLSAVLAVLSACGAGPSAADDAGKPDVTTGVSLQPTGEPDARADGADPDKGIVCDANGVSVTVTGARYDESEKHWYVDVTVINSTDADINVSALEGTVNGLRVPLQLYTECPAGQSVEDAGYFDPQTIAHCVGTGLLSEIRSVGLKVAIIDGADDRTVKWTAEAPAEVAVEPIFIEQSLAEFPYVKKLEQTVCEEGGLRVRCLGLAEDFYGLSDNPYLYFVVENGCGSPVTVGYPRRYTTYADILAAVENPTDTLGLVNGAPCGIGFLHEDVESGTSAVFCVPILAEKYGVQPGEIATVQLELRICDRYDSAAGVDMVFPVELQF